MTDTETTALTETVDTSKTFPKRPKTNGDYPTKAAAAVMLRIAGADFTTIAEELNYANASAARNAYEQALASAASDPKDIEHQRLLTHMRLERLLLSVWEKANDANNPDQVAYVRSALSIIDRHARLLGLDAPQQMVIHTPDARSVTQWVEYMVSQVTGGEILAESDIIDAEEVGDDE